MHRALFHYEIYIRSNLQNSKFCTFISNNLIHEKITKPEILFNLKQKQK